MRANYPQALFLDLLDPETFRTIGARPERLRELVDGNPQRRPVVIDEVQKLPEILSLVHALRETDKRLQFVLTGSSARKLKRTGVNLLAGRALLRTMHPFLAAELGERFRLERALRQGMLPLVVAAANPEDVLRSYVALYVQEEVKAEGLTRNVGAFARFLEAASFSHGAVLSISAVARECQVHRKLVENYFGILEDLLLAFRLPVFARCAKRRTVAAPKFFFFDAGVYRSLRPAGPLDRPAEIEGAALEGLVAQQLRALASLRNDGSRLFYWRTRSGLEVDLVWYGKSVFTAIEVKNSARIRQEDLRSPKAFGEEYPQAERLLLYRGRERLQIEGIACLPCEEYLRSLKA